MKRVRICNLCCLGLALVVPVYSGTCPEISEGTAIKLASYVHDQFGFAASSLIKLERSEILFPDLCYRKVTFARTDTKAEYALYLSADQRFLSRDLLDSTLLPRTRGADEESHMMRDLTSTSSPSIGPEQAVVTITIFSDFECPFCKRQAEIFRRDLMPSAPDIRFVFRNFPLPSHPWARAAAEMAACVYDQDHHSFWGLHDFLFAKQDQITERNVGGLVDGWIREQDLDFEMFRTCYGEHKSSNQIERDLRFANDWSLQATPTVFVNGVRYEGVIDLEDMKAIIRSAKATAAR